jgi:hypothetical protein
MTESSRDRPECANGEIEAALQHIWKVRSTSDMTIVCIAAAVQDICKVRNAPDMTIMCTDEIVETCRGIRARLDAYLFLTGIDPKQTKNAASCLLEIDDDYMDLIGSATEEPRTIENMDILDKLGVPLAAVSYSRNMIVERILLLAQKVTIQKNLHDAQAVSVASAGVTPRRREESPSSFDSAQGDNTEVIPLRIKV